MASPRCHSRDSSVGGRCPSDDSNYSGRSNSAAPNNATSPIAISLPATLPPGAAASLLPPQSAAMAAYLVAAQQNRLLMSGHPMALTRNTAGSPPMSSPIGNDSSVLDFSTKRKTDYDQSPQKNCDNDSVMNLTKTDNGPLDLTVNRKRYNSSPPPPTLASQRKMPRSVDYKPPVVSPWTSPMTPYFAAAVAAASLSPKNPNVADWNGSKHKMTQQNDATKALEKMSELSRIGGNEVGRHSTNNNHNNSNINVGSGSVNSGGGSSGASTGRHSAWQSHWLNKGADSVKDVFKCVWCKQSFPTLETLTTHMKETQHMGVNVPHSNNASGVGSGGGGGGNNSGHQSQHQSQSHHHQTPSSTSGGSGSGNSVQSKADLNLLIKETMPLPRKLVRGQDVWLGKGAEQTRQILKCMWCGQSFRSLSEMTTHMQQTQHYTNIISQEQIISWKSSDDTKGGGGSGTGGGAGGQSGPNGPGTAGGGSGGSGASSTVSAVLTCKVCDQAFSSLKDLSNHMVKNAHYKEHIMRSISESGGRRRQTREKRKKSLPVRKLLELERAQHEFKNGDTHAMNKTMRDIGPGRITCEKCGDKIDTIMFVEHIRQCVGGGVISPSHRNILKSSLGSNNIIPPDSISPMTPNSRDGRKSIGDDSTSPNSRHISPNATSPILKEMANIGGGGGGGSGDKTNSPSVLNALEQLIEKSFDTRTRHGASAGSFAANNQQSAPLGSSILKRLGIDESVDYTKPLIDPQTMNFLRNYSQQNAAQYGRRERSGSESSSVSDRGSSRMNSLTPERKLDGSLHGGTPRATPDKMSLDGGCAAGDDEPKSLVSIKREPIDDDDHGIKLNNSSDDQPLNISIKREIDDDDRPKSIKQEIDSGGAENLVKRHSSTISSSPAPSPRQSTPGGQTTPMASPCSERSATPRSTPGASTEKKPSTSGSLGALSSMFDSLTGNSAAGNSTDTTSQSKKGSSHPLAALQKLCDKTENTSQNSRQNSTATTQALAAPTQSNSSASGAMLAFSWACNDAVMTSDSIIKCAFCDTPFCSKGAYRHHLSKVHFVKDDMIEQAAVTKPLNRRQQSTPPASAPAHSPKSNNSHSSSSGGSGVGGGGGSSGGNSGGNGNGGNGNNSSHSTNNSNNNSGNGISMSNANSAKSPPPSLQPGAAFEESPHSKFLKYTELAKQLSSKYV